MKLDSPSRRKFLKSSASLFGYIIFPYNKVFSNPSLKTVETPMKTSGIVIDPRYLDHILEAGHPESPERLQAVYRQLEKSGLMRTLVRILPVHEPEPFIKKIHPDRHLELVRKQAGDETICRLAVSGVLAAIDAVCGKKVKNAFCAIRPPGHHATNIGEYGFCFYNNVAIGARYAQEKYHLKKVLIVDWDFHHGNATEWAFYDDPTVLFFSTHAQHVFPGTGSPDRKGAGAGLGYNINVPLPRGADDNAIIEAFQNELVPAAERFKPDLVLISAGFDSRKDDPLGYFNITDAGFVKLTEIVMAIAEKYADSRIVSVLEGGYNPKGLALAVEAHIRTLGK